MPTYFRLLTFFIIYFIIQQLLYLNEEFAFCMQASTTPQHPRAGMAKWFGGSMDVSPETGNVHFNITALNPTNTALSVMDHEERITQIVQTILPPIRNSIDDAPQVMNARIHALVPPLIAEARESVRSSISRELVEAMQSERSARIVDIARISQELSESNNRVTAIQNSFEHKLAEKEQLINTLRRDHDNLVRQVSALEESRREMRSDIQHLQTSVLQMQNSLQQVHSDLRNLFMQNVIQRQGVDANTMLGILPPTSP
jgi:hypothetical protein